MKIWALILVILVGGCATDPTSFSVPAGQPVAATTVSLPTAALQTAPQTGTARRNGNRLIAKQDLPTFEAQGMCMAVIGVVIDSVGEDRKILATVLGVPQETRGESTEKLHAKPTRMSWHWQLVQRPEVWYVTAASSNKSPQVVEHVHVSFGHEMHVSTLLSGERFDSPKVYWGGSYYSNKTHYVVVGRGNSGKMVRIYANSEVPVALNKPSLNDDGQRVNHFVANPAFHWSQGIIMKVSSGERPIVNVTSDGFLSMREDEYWKELKGAQK